MAMEVVHDNMGDGNMQCTSHPYKNSAPGGICAFCLQEKLGKLISSSFPAAIFPSSSSSRSPSPSFRSDFGVVGGSSTAAAAAPIGSGSTLQLHSISSQSGGNHASKSRLPSGLPGTGSKMKKKDAATVAGNSDSASPIVFNRSKSSATARRSTQTRFLDEKCPEPEGYYSPHKRGFWSFLYVSKHYNSTAKKDNRNKHLNITAPSTVSTSSSAAVVSSSVNMAAGGGKRMEDFVAVDENGGCPDQATFDRKVSRSRSVGCGSRSFSGDLFERISTGFGDCTLRRVESQREGKPKTPSDSVHRNSSMNGQDCIKERVKCGGIFSGFMITSSSSSSWNWVSVSDGGVSRKSIYAARSAVGHHNPSHGRNKSWGWAFASPMRAFSAKPSTGK